MKTNTDNQCVVVFPVYKSLSNIERAFFEQAIRMTEKYRHVFITSHSFIFDDSFGDLANLDVVRFDDSYFSSIQGYNYLMLSEEFYEAFLPYEYILIHQSDAFLFNDNLGYWCNMGYDYIGAPWLKPKKMKKGKFYNNFLYRIIPNSFPKTNKRKVQECYNTVGNGGLSLRKVETCLTILKQEKSQYVLNIYKKELQSNTLYNEDIFWSVEAPHLLKSFSKPNWKEGISFSLETHAAYAYRIMKNQLPFGCHAPAVYEPDFWKTFIPALNTEIE